MSTRKLTISVLIVLLSGFALLIGSVSSPTQAAPSVQEPPSLQDLIVKAQRGGTVLVIVGLNVAFRPEVDLNSPQDAHQRQLIDTIQSIVLQKMAGSNITLVAKYRFIPYMAVEVDAAALEKLAALSETTTFEEDIPVSPTLASSIPVIGANNAWAVGFTGSGQTIAILDTGVDKTHPFFTTGGDKVVSEACYSTTRSGTGFTSTSVCPGGVSESTAVGSGIDCTAAAAGNPKAVANCRHGTHVAGIAAGNDGGVNIGVARDADIIAIQAFSLFTNSPGSGFCGSSADCALSWTHDQIKGLERVLVLHNTTALNIAAVNMSLGGGKYSTPCDGDSRKAAIDRLRAVGIATVISSGNENYTNTMSAPACISTAVSVGATDDADNVASFSNIASFINLLAPGVSINSSVPGGGIANFNGTSMAAPHVAGTWAILRQKAPTASVNNILTALRNTGVLVNDNRADGTVTNMRRVQLDSLVARIIVNTNAPIIDPNDGRCSLIEAIIAANTDTASGSVAGECAAGFGADTILLQASGPLYRLPTVDNNTTDGPNGLPSITSEIIIRDNHAPSSLIDRSTAPGTPDFRIFHVASTGHLTLEGVIVQNGRGVNGGGIFNRGTVTLTNSNILGNEATDCGGGIFNDGGIVRLTDKSRAVANEANSGSGIYNNGGVVVLDNSAISHNINASGGGGIFNATGSVVELTNSTVNGNGATFLGGGIFNDGTMVLFNSTISGNTATFGGGIQNNTGALELTNSTVSDNSAVVSGGGISNGGTVKLINTIVADNPSGGDCSNSWLIISNGYNLDSDNTCNLVSPTDLPGRDPRLGPLEYLGGPAGPSFATLVHGLYSDSPAIDAGSCRGYAADQRGASRPVDIPWFVNADDGCDIGAFEYQRATAVTLTSFTAAAGSDHVTLAWETASETDNESFNLWRSEAADGEYTKINAALIPAEGSADTGASYTYTDADVVRGVTYYYKLEDVDLHGVSAFHGPVSATPGQVRIYLPLVFKSR